MLHKNSSSHNLVYMRFRSAEYKSCGDSAQSLRCESRILTLGGKEITCNKHGSIMHVEILHVPPSSSSFIPLSTHQSQTPSSFFSSTPVLHFSNRKATLLSTIPSSTTDAESTLPPLFRGAANGADEQVFVEDVDVWVTSA